MKFRGLIALTVAVLLTPSAAFALDNSKALNSSLLIVTNDAQGSGFSLETGVVLTAKHVVTGVTEISVSRVGEKKDFTGEVIKAADECDVAEIRVDTDTLPTYTVALQPVEIGQTVFAVGSPDGKPTVSQGKVLDVNAISITADSKTDFGASGGPLLNASGEVVGLITSKDSWGNSIATPISLVEKCLTADLSAADRNQASSTFENRSIGLLALVVALVALVLSLFALRQSSQRRRPIVITLPQEENRGK